MYHMYKVYDVLLLAPDPKLLISQKLLIRN